MIIPANFIVGAIVGGLATYVSKDEPTKEWFKGTTSKVKEGSQSFIGSFKRKPQEVDAEPSEADSVANNDIEKEIDEVTDANEKASKSVSSS